MVTLSGVTGLSIGQGPQEEAIVSLGVSTVETNQDRDREHPLCRDKLLKTVEIILNVKINFYFISVKIFKIEIFRSRFIFVKIFIEIVETNRDR